MSSRFNASITSNTDNNVTNNTTGIASESSNDDVGSRSRVSSALTVENVKSLEEKVGNLNVIELFKTDHQNHNFSEFQDVIDEFNFSEEEPLRYATPDPSSSPIILKDPSISLRNVTKGIKFTGEEYTAISIDVQTDESWIAELGYWKGQHNQKGVIVSPFPAISNSFKKRNGKYFTDTSDNEDASKSDKNNESTYDNSFKDMEAEFVDNETDSPMLKPDNSMKFDFEDSDSILESQDDQPIAVGSVGPPSILKYKAESGIKQLDYKKVKPTYSKDMDLENLSVEQQQYYSEMLDEMKELRKERKEKKLGELIDIQPHTAVGSQKDVKVAKEHAAERNRLREIEKQKQTVGTTHAGNNQTNFYAFARQLKTVNYALSSEKCMDEGWTIIPVTPVAAESIEENVFPLMASNILSGKRYDQKFVYKTFSNGSPFIAIFPDGTGTVWYSSGNPAISIIAAEKSGRLSFIAHQDKSEEDMSPGILGVFSANGHCACYHTNGSLQMILSPVSGEYFNKLGVKTKQWNWRGLKEHVHAPPFQPITFSLNKNTAVRVLSQENIYVNFNDGQRTVRFNVGTKLLLHQKNKLPKIVAVESEQAALEEKIVYVRMILERVNNLLQFPNSPNLKKIKLPEYLAKKGRQELRNKVDEIQQRQSLPPIKLYKKSKKTVKKPIKLPKFYKQPALSDNLLVTYKEKQPLVVIN